MHSTRFATAVAFSFLALAVARASDATRLTGVVDASGDKVAIKTGTTSLALSGSNADIFGRFPGRSITVVGDPATNPFVLEGVVALTSSAVYFDPGYADVPSKIGTLAAGTAITRLVDAIPVPADGPPEIAGKTLLRVGIPFSAVEDVTVGASDFMASNASAFIDADAVFGPAPVTPTGLVQASDDGVTVQTPTGPAKLTGSVADVLSKLAGKTIQLAGDGSASPFAGVVTQKDVDVYFDPGYADAPSKIGTLPKGTVVPVLVDAITAPSDAPAPFGGRTLLRVGIPFDAVKDATVGRSDFMVSNASVFIDADALVAAPANAPAQGPRVGMDRAIDPAGN